MSIHFCESTEVEETLPELREQNIAVMEIDGSCLTSREDVFKAFAIALRMPKGWYGDEEYAPNVDAFLEYLDNNFRPPWHRSPSVRLVRVGEKSPYRSLSISARLQARAEVHCPIQSQPIVALKLSWNQYHAI